MYPIEEGAVTSRMGVDPSKQKQSEEIECAEVYEAVDEEFFQHFCSKFGQLFFLEPE